MPIDVVVTDMLRPTITGLKMLEYIHKWLRNIPVIVISDQEDPRVARKRAASYVHNTELASRLSATIKQVLAAFKSEKAIIN